LSLFRNLGLSPDGVEDVLVPFGEWLPDLPAVNNPGALEALNVIPAEGVYVPFKQLEITDPAVADAVCGATSVFTGANVQVYAGTTTHLYTRESGAYTSIYELPVSGSLEATDAWQFVRVSETMVALHPGSVPIAHEIGTINPVSLVGGAPPTAACGAYISDFLVLGNLTVDPADGSGYFPARVRWGGQNNIDSPWVTDVATMADFQDMPAEGGAVVAITGREFGTIFQERMIRRMTFEGLPGVFAFDTVEDKRGALARDAVVDIGALTLFPAEDGFFAWNGTNTQPIGDNKVNRYFLNKLSYPNRGRIVGAVDHDAGCVMWAFPTDISGSLTEIIIFSYRENRWSHSIQTVEYIFNTATPATVVDDLGGVIDDYTASFDGPSYRAGRPTLAAFDQYHRLGMFTGLPMAATLDTGEFSGPNMRRVFANGARPNVDVFAPVATVEALYRDQFSGEALQYGGPVAQEADGTCPVLVDGRFTRFRLRLPANISWRHALGIDVSRKATGKF
jgi:hypothetical protein